MAGKKGVLEGIVDSMLEIFDGVAFDTVTTKENDNGNEAQGQGGNSDGNARGNGSDGKHPTKRKPGVGNTVTRIAEPPAAKENDESEDTEDAVGKETPTK